MKKMLGCCALIAFAGACDSQTTSDYKGEKLATLKGTVSTEVGAATSAELALLYPAVFPSNWTDMHWVNRVPVTGSFPSSFTLDLYAPPPSLLQVSSYDTNHVDQYKFSLQTIAAVATNSPTFPVKIGDCILGEPQPKRLFVLYLERDLVDEDVAPDFKGSIPVGGPFPKASEYFGVTTAGYHLLEVTSVSDDDGRPLSFAPAAGGFETPISITITRSAGPDCREPRTYPYDGGVP
jgi:hypothetical protein